MIGSEQAAMKILAHVLELEREGVELQAQGRDWEARKAFTAASTLKSIGHRMLCEAAIEFTA